ncbi:MAG: hypothetical protein Q9186_003427 [Xanthomendoza sp. 1 TL-2023]
MPYFPDSQEWLRQSGLLLEARPTTSRAHLVLKTYDPASGVCLKYMTGKAAEVGRLVAALGKCGRAMAGLPLQHEAITEGVEADGKIELNNAPEISPAVGSKEAAKSGPQAEAQTQRKGQGGGKRKKGKK